MREKVLLAHKFVEFIPRELEPNTIYVSITYATAIHNCCCGCGNRVVTPLSQADWRLIFDGRTISLEPSIGNWSFPCRSHYWIRSNRVVWSDEWSDEQIAAGRQSDARVAAEVYFGDKKRKKSKAPADAADKKPGKKKPGLKRRIKNWLGVKDSPEH